MNKTLFLKFENFIKKLIFKHDIIAQHTDMIIELNYGIVTDDPSESKYYLNLAGMLHKTDPIPVIEIGDQSLKVDRDLIKNTEDLYLDFINYGPIFNSLCNTYPSLVTYFRSLITDITLEQALDANDNSILYYENNDIIEENNVDIIIKLNNFADNYFKTYNNINYISDELYVPALVGIFYSFLPVKLLNILLSEINDYRVSSIIRDLYYKSYNRLPGNFIESNLSLKDKLKFIGELPFLRTNIGKNSSLDIVKDLFQDLQIELKNLYITNDKPVLLEDNIPYPEKPLMTTETKITDLNKYFSLSNILNSMDEIGYIDVKDTYTLLNIDEDKLKYTNNNIHLTKIFYVEDIYYVNFNPLGALGILLNFLTVNINNTTTTIQSRLVEGINFNKDSITYRDILNMILTILISSESDVSTANFVENILLKSTLNANFPSTNLMDTLVYVDELTPLIRDIKSYVDNIRNTNEPTLYLQLYIDLFNNLWKLLCNTKDSNIQADIRNIISDIYTDEVVNVNIDLNTWRQNTGFTIDSTIDKIKLINNITSSYFGFYVSDYYSILDDMLERITLFDKLTSYSVNLVYSTDIVNSARALFNTSNLSFSYNADIKARYKFDEYTPIDLKTYVKDIATNVISTSSEYTPTITSTKIKLLAITSPILTDNVINYDNKVLPNKSKTEFNNNLLSIPTEVLAKTSTTTSIYTENNVQTFTTDINTTYFVKLGNTKLPEKSKTNFYSSLDITFFNKEINNGLSTNYKQTLNEAVTKVNTDIIINNQISTNDEILPNKSTTTLTTNTVSISNDVVTSTTTDFSKTDDVSVVANDNNINSDEDNIPTITVITNI